MTGLQQVRHTLAEVKTDCMFSRVVTDQLIEAYANDDMDQQTVSMAKVKSECFCLITDVLLVTKTPKMSENELAHRNFLAEDDVI